MNGIRIAHCNYCGEEVPAHGVRNTTSSARNHYLKCKLNPANIRTDQTYINFPKAGSSELTGSLKWQFDKKVLWDTVVDKFLVDGTPYAEIDKPGFRKMCKVGFHPSFTLPGRKKLAAACMSRHESLRDQLKKYFSTRKQRASLTSDCWTSSNQNLSYLSLTAHFIDDNFKLQKKIVSFVQIDSHAGVDMAYVIENCLREWGIEQVFCITLDNASSNDVMAKTLRDTVTDWGGSLLGGIFMHMRCSAHIINLVVTDGLDEHQPSIQKVRGCVVYMKRSPGRWKALKEAAVLEKVTTKKHLWLDCPTRWNGSYIMLDRAVQYKKAFERYGKVVKTFRKDMEGFGGIPEKEDWESVERLVKFLEHFYNLTKKISGSWYVTSNILLPEISDLYTKMKKLSLDKDVAIKAMALRMIKKFDKYWGDSKKINMLICFALVLDPRMKILFLSFFCMVQSKDHFLLKL